eukprot:CAMPEP_0174268330 /NCGR_PEP_ID=MMETSP0439-20130205/37039_1 /TAXON_ID=0 /ORGANISM="Stereomyxa ramosa, Strain Chinc5" /LENGTH=54 /DNA_ID=CAMNT_0015356431 /DNA_START=606 /DNA_END=770 /DNA_ORIENTATION=-
MMMELMAWKIPLKKSDDGPDFEDPLLDDFPYLLSKNELAAFNYYFPVALDPIHF